MELAVPDRANRAEQLRRKTIAVFEEHGPSKQAARLGPSGYDGYTDEEDFMYHVMASRMPFEVAQDGVAQAAPRIQDGPGGNLEPLHALAYTEAGGLLARSL